MRSKAASRQAKISHWTLGDRTHEKFIVLPFSSCDKTDVKPGPPSHEIFLMAFRKWTWKYTSTHSQAHSVLGFDESAIVEARLSHRIKGATHFSDSVFKCRWPPGSVLGTHTADRVVGDAVGRRYVDCVETRLVIIHATSGNKHSLSRNCFQLL